MTTTPAVAPPRIHHSRALLRATSWAPSGGQNRRGRRLSDFGQIRATMLALDRHGQNLFAAIGTRLRDLRAGRRRRGVVAKIIIAEVDVVQVVVFREIEKAIDALLAFCGGRRLLRSSRTGLRRLMLRVLRGRGRLCPTGNRRDLFDRDAVFGGDFDGGFLAFGGDLDGDPLTRLPHDSSTLELLLGHDTPPMGLAATGVISTSSDDPIGPFYRAPPRSATLPSDFRADQFFAMQGDSPIFVGRKLGQSPTYCTLLRFHRITVPLGNSRPSAARIDNGTASNELAESAEAEAAEIEQNSSFTISLNVSAS